MLGAHDVASLADASKFDTWAGEHKLNPAILRRWMTDLEGHKKNHDPIFVPWFDLAALGENDFAVKAKPLLENLLSDSKMANPVVAKALSEGVTNSLKDVAAVYNQLFKRVDADWKAALESAKKETKEIPKGLAEPGREALRQVLYAEGTAVNLPRAEAETIQSRRLHEGSAPFRNRIEALGWTHPGAPPRAMAMADRSTPANSHVLIRGNPGSPGDEVPRRFVEVLNPVAPSAFTNGSGRLELAQAIANRANPLTARVYVNRLWLHHFGEGIVPTPGDFGVRTEEPVHHALLDFLAASFMENGWSTKWLQRQILLSAAYQQSSDPSASSLKADPDNRLLSRMNRQRLDFEALRDTLLSLSATLDPTLGGIPVDLQSEPFSARRTLYGLIDRQNLPGLFRTFDFANPDVSNQSRFRTTVPQQALFLMNSPFVLQQAHHLSERDEVKQAGCAEDKIEALYHIVLQRPASRIEIQLGEKFLAAQAQPGAKLSPLEKYAQVLLLSNEVMFVD
jgi:hypothetical protein